MQDSGGEKRGSLITFSNKDTVSVERRNATCLECHRGGGRTFWAGGAHESRGIACTSCHQIMKQGSEKSMLKYASAMETCCVDGSMFT